MPEDISSEGQKNEPITYERFFAIGVGQIGLTPQAFDDMTPAQFYYAWMGWRKLEESRMHDAWERQRWATYFQVMVHVDPKRRGDLFRLLRLPWDGDHDAAGETLTRDERKKRVEEILKHSNHGSKIGRVGH